MDPLTEVFEVEQGTRALLDAERGKAAQWLEETQRTIDQTTASEIARVDASAAAEQAAARDAAAAKAREIVNAAESLAARVASCDDARLRPIVWRRLATIVPGPKT